MTPAPFGRSAATLVTLAALFGAAGVAAAAIAAHRVGDPSLATAADFLILHALAILGLVAVGGVYRAGRLLAVPAWMLAGGVLLFSGSLTLKAFFGQSPVPLAAPVGGALMIAGWLAAAVGAVAHRLRRSA